MPQVILALPAYNEAGAIGDLLTVATQAFETIRSYQPRILVVDDGSADDTGDRVRAFQAPFPVEVVTHEQNRGLGGAIYTALLAALARSTDPDDVIVNMDADNTHPPATIPAMLEALENGVDVVIASRYRPGARQVGVPLNRRFLSFGAGWSSRGDCGCRGCGTTHADSGPTGRGRFCVRWPPMARSSSRARGLPARTKSWSTWRGWNPAP
jgi:dolichol-phosphate mannosyltransferase